MKFTKSYQILTWISLILLGFSSSSFSAAYEGAGLGNRAIAMGGAFIGLADDWTAIYWNPAGLTQLEGKGVAAGVLYSDSFVSGSGSMTNYPKNSQKIEKGDFFLKVYPSEPNTFQEEDVRFQYYRPGLGGYVNRGSYTLGMGVYVPISTYMEWEDRVKDETTKANIYGKYYNKFFTAVTNFSLAKKLTNNLSGGIGLNYIYAKGEREIKKTYKNSLTPLAPPYSFLYEEEATGSGLEAVGGLLYKVNPEFSIGLVIRSGSTVELDGDANSKLEGQAIAALGQDYDERDSYTQKFIYPLTYGIGAAFKPQDKWIVTADIGVTQWSAIKMEKDFSKSGVVLKDLDLDPDWKDRVRWRLGTEYKISDKTTIYGGYLYDPSPVPDEGVALSTIPDINKHFFTLGGDYKFGSSKIGLLYNYLAGEKRTVIRDSEEIDYKGGAHNFVLEWGYSF